MKSKLFFSLVLIIAALLLNPALPGLSEKIEAAPADTLKSLDGVFSSLLKKTFEDLSVPGAIIGVSVPGYKTLIKTYGVADLLTGQPISQNDHMRIGSVTKTFTGTVLLQLVDAGLISLDDKLSKYFPDFPNGDNITIEQLGNMTSGIYNYSEDESFQNTLMNDLTKPFTPMEVIGIALKHEPYFPPGTSMHYSNTNTILLGLIVEKLTGNTLSSEIKNRILDPLGMSETLFATDTDFPNPHAHGYLYMDSADLTPRDVTLQNPSWGWSAGAMISTLEDVMKYTRALGTGELVTGKTQQLRLKWGKTFVAPGGAWKDLPLEYGFAIADFDGAIGHNGGIPGYNTFMAYVPGKDAVIVVLVNMQDNKAGIGPADYIGRVINDKLKTM